MEQLAEALGEFETRSARLTRERELLLERRARWLDDAVWIYDQPDSPGSGAPVVDPPVFRWTPDA